MRTLALGVGGGLLAKGIHIAFQEGFGNGGAPIVAREFRSQHDKYSTPFKVMNVAEHVLIIPLGEEVFFRALPAYLTHNPIVNFALMPTLFGAMHYDGNQGALNVPYVLSQISSGLIFAAVMKVGGFPAAFTAHAVSNLYSVCSILS